MTIKIQLLKGNRGETKLKLTFNQYSLQDTCLIAEVSGKEIFKQTIKQNNILDNIYICDFCPINKSMKYIWFYTLIDGRKVYIDRISIYEFKRIQLGDNLEWYFKQASQDFSYRYGG